jgi:GAF domain-containing protein
MRFPGDGILPLSRISAAVDGQSDPMSAERADQVFHESSLDVQAAFAELAGISLGKESMSSVLDRVAELAKKTIPGVAEASVSLMRNDKATTAAYTGRLALDLDETQYGRGYGPCLESAASGEVLEITDARRETRWPDYTPVAVDRGALSSLSVPLPIQPVVHGGLNLYGIEAEAFDDEARDAARVFASYAAVAVQNMNLYETTRDLAANLDAAMQSRAVIEQAKGILMREHHCDAGVAFEILRSASQRYNRKLRDIAQGIVDGVGRPPKGGTAAVR